MSQVAVLVASHGEFAKHALKSAEMIVGEQDNCGVVIVSMDLTLADAEKELAEELNKLDRSAGTVILVDIFGGTPSNMSGRIVLSEENVLAVSGLNLPMLLDLFSNTSNIKLHIFSPEKFLEVIQKNPLSRNTMLLFSSPFDVEKLVNADYEIPSLNVGGMRGNAERTQYTKAVSLTPESDLF
ncbi:PTS sugar transporter subunit IIA domain-containing protein [Oceanobacillus sojae]|uniref:PTS sugar transporter subunit IIA domain-containing protein n=1 Tax=Oceanobacillus sojae TaxID=582851 RepID=UPI00363DD066